MNKLVMLGLWGISASAFADGAAPAQGSSLPSILMLVIFLVVFYFLLIRPQQRRNKEQKDLLANLAKGDEVLTTSGIFGKVNNLTDTYVELSIASNVSVRIQKQAIASLLPKGSIEV